MPKRTRDEEVKAKAPPAQLSAFARRQLLQAKNSAPASPAPASPKSSTPAPATPSIEDIPPLAPALKRKTKKKKTKDDTPDAPTAEKATSSSTLKSSKRNVNARKKLESALSRQLEDAQRRKEEEELFAAQVAGNEIELVEKNGEVNSSDDVEELMLVDESGEDENRVNSRVLFNGRGRANSTLTQISSFVPTESNIVVYTQGSMKYSLMATEAIVFQGEYTLCVLSGSVKVYEATLTPSSGTHVVWAPSTHAMPVIEALPNKKGNRDQKRDGEFDAEIVVGNHTSGIRDIGRVWPMLGGVWAPPNTSKKDETYHLLTTSTSPPNILAIPSNWSSVLSDFTTPGPPPPVILVTGPKSSGKSTLCRTLTNTLLNTYPKVAYLDLDPGQPEFSPPGIVSLSVLSTPILSPPFTHPAGPVCRKSKRHRAHHLGFVSPREDPGGYIQAAGELFRAYTHLNDSHIDPSHGIPLVVNTCGWIKGTGLELLHDLINITQPSDVVLLHSHSQLGGDPANTILSDILAIMPHRTRFHQLPPPTQATANAKFSAADLRTLHTISYFHHSVIPGAEPRISWSFKNPLTHAQPWVLPAKEISAGIHILHLTPSLPAQLLRDAIEGTIVGVILVDNEDEQMGDKATLDDGLPYPFPAPPPTPENSHCVGLAVIRAIDTAKNEVQLILPPRDQYLSEANSSREGLALVRGRLEGSVWDFVSQEFKLGEDVPWMTCDGAAGQGGKGVRQWRVRRNLMRRGQVRSGGGGNR